MKQMDKTKRSYPPSAPVPRSGSRTNAAPAANTSPGTNINERPSSQALSQQISQWVLLPMRLFLGITFVYAGMQKLTDPQFFNPSARGYIGKQMLAFAGGSPLHNFLIYVALPHAHLFGLLVAFGEIAIGLGTLLGLLLRPAAFFGLLLSLMFFLSASWHVFPYFYGADIVFVFCWLTMLLAGPASSVLPALDTRLARYLLTDVPAQWRPQLASLVYIVLGVKESSTEAANRLSTNQGQFRQPAPNYRSRQTASRRSQTTRRNFLWGLVTGGGGMLVALWLGQNFRILRRVSDDAPVAAPTTAPSNGNPAPTTTQGSATSIAQVNSVPTNSAVNFTVPSNGDPGVLVHLSNGKFVAFDATCTHAGCPVQYDPGSQHLLCPCHGAEFDPANGAAVVQGPTNTPLTSVPISVNNTTGTISTSG